MNHLKPREVKIECREMNAHFVVTFKELGKQQYSEEDLNYEGSLVLPPEKFREFLDNYLKQIRS